MSFWDKILAVLTAIATGSINFTSRVWRDVSIGIRRDAVILETGKDPGFAAFENLDGLKPSDMEKLLEGALAKLFQLGFDVTGDAFKPVLDALLAVHKSTLAPLKDVKPGDAEAAATKILGEAIGAGVGAHFAACLGESLFPTKTLGLPQLAALMAELAGFKEIMAGIIHPEVTALVGRPHAYAVNARARSTLPNLAGAANLHARGLLSQAKWAELAGFNGIGRDYEDVTRDAAYHGYSPRMLLRVIESGLFSHAEIVDELTFNGMRPASQDRMLKAAPYLATSPQRNQLHAALFNSALAGLLSDDELTAQIDAAESNTDRDSLILARLHVEQRVNDVKELTQAYTIQFESHLLDPLTFQANLESLGLSNEKVTALLAVSESKVNAAFERILEADERRLERQTIADERKAALRNFKNGNLDSVGLAAALLLTGLSPVQAAAWTDLASLEQAGASRYVYGQLLSPSDATLLRERVAAVGSQFKKQLLTVDQARAQLAALNVDQPDLNALLAKWAAELAAATKHGELIDPLTGQPAPKPPAP